MAIIDLPSGIAWRGRFQPAAFGDATFHVDTGIRKSGRRIVSHQFPKRDIPYAEDMGRRAREFTVRGYIIAYVRDDVGGDLLRQRNYIPARDRLITALETEGPRPLTLPFLGTKQVVPIRYRVTEEDKLGGYCTFDMTFVEYGKAPAEGARQGSGDVTTKADSLGAAVNTGVQSKLSELVS